jgi:exodeoxyribonuclease V alpha subunit
MEVLEGTLRSFLVDGAIARLEAPGRGEVKIIGTLTGLAPGERVRVEGEWEQHRKYGPQFRVHSATPIVPQTADGVQRYLGSGRVPGIGQEIARRIVEKFGAAALDVIEKEPHRLREVEGLGKKRIAAIRESMTSHRAVREVMVFLQGHGVSPAFAARIQKKYGDEAIQVVRANPYRLARDVSGIGFIKADEIARSLGWKQDAPERIEAGVLHALHEAADEGHVFATRDELARAAAQGLGSDIKTCEAAVERLRQQGSVIVEDDAVFQPELHADEVLLGQRLRALAAAQRTPVKPPEDLARFSEGQRRAVELACTQPLLVVTGGPGTGKTTVTRAIVAAHLAAGQRVQLASPTGRAAKRLSEATGRPARTIHRLLEWDGRGGFLRGPGAELEADLVVIDEASMLDVELARSLVQAVPVGAALVFVGDVDQLPSVGPGQVLRDIIQSGTTPVVRLTEIFRQARESRIVLAAHAINEGRLPETTPAESDFYFIRADDPVRARELVVRVVTERIPARFGLDPLRDVQVLSPMRRGELGTFELGRSLQETINPRGKPVGRFRVGDKVIQTRNDYDRDVYNGDLGFVLDTDGEGGLSVEIDGRAVAYDADELGDLDLAYAMTVHRSQGSEYPAVVMPVATQHFVMLQRNLLYTAVTRAKKLCVLVGNPRALAMAVKNAETKARRTKLAERLRG